MKNHKPISLKKVKTYSLCSRRSKVSVRAFATPPVKGTAVRTFLNNLPDVLAARDLLTIADAILSARQKGRPVILGMGAHPIKVGLSPVIIDLMQKGIITAIAANGACTVHDFEIALAGYTSEDVARELCSGSFGMARETGRSLNQAVTRGVRRGLGIGAAVGDFIEKGSFTYKDKSIFASARRLKVPATVHVAIGTDIIHMHPEADGAAIGKGSMTDFRILAANIADMDGGVYINLGSAVILPEVFLKALNIARNLGNAVNDITTVNMDFIQHYRPRENVLKRPTMNKGRSFALTGHHEIMFPLLAAAIIERSK